MPVAFMNVHRRIITGWSKIADFINQLYEYFFLEKNGIKKTQKNISSELLASFDRQLTETEDIKAQLHKAVLN